MLYVIAHWHGGKLPEGTFKAKVSYREILKHPSKRKPEAVYGEPEKVEADVVLIDDLLKFIEKNGPCIVEPPMPHFPHWFIWVTDGSGRFRQK